MADASAEDEEVEDLVGAEVLVVGVEDAELQRVEDAADGIYHAATDQPKEAGERKCMI